ncbi:MAG: cytochrome b/b6 domain-containing protein [Eggerthellales bacterium]|nr:cytochrome b/b6 domain-containing protein [Eggerthellales bacterium]
MAHLAHYKEAHPLPFVITHYVNLVCMIILILTGFMIHFPSLPVAEGVMRGPHILCGFILVINAIVRVILAFVLESAPTLGTRITVKDYKVWLPQADNKHQLIPWLKYYFFLKKEHPIAAKYGVPQKLAYIAVFFLILLMFWTGTALWEPTAGLPFNQWLIGFCGGLMSLRIVHYFGMFVFLIFMLIHIYLCCMEGVACLKLMFLRKETPGAEYDVLKHVEKKH